MRELYQPWHSPQLLEWLPLPVMTNPLKFGNKNIKKFKGKKRSFFARVLWLMNSQLQKFRIKCFFLIVKDREA